MNNDLRYSAVAHADPPVYADVNIVKLGVLWPCSETYGYAFD